MRYPSPALAIAVLALAVATTGTASATGLINGQSIKNHSITANKLAANSVTGRAIRPASVTTTDLANGVIVNNTVVAPAGPQGPAGATGTPGVAVVDPAKLIVVSGNDAVTPSASTAGSGAICPDGTFVVGGGYSSLGSGVNQLVVAIESHAESNGWNVQTHNYGGADQATPYHAIAYCAARS